MNNPNDNIKATPAELITEIKEGLINVGYATEATDDGVVQDKYFKWVIVNSTGDNPLMPYSLDSVPQGLKAYLPTTEPEFDGVYRLRLLNKPGEYQQVIDKIVDGTMPLGDFLESYIANSALSKDYIRSGFDNIRVSENGSNYIVSIPNFESFVQTQTPDGTSLNTCFLNIMEIVGADDEYVASFSLPPSPTSPKVLVHSPVNNTWTSHGAADLLTMSVRDPSNEKHYLVIPTVHGFVPTFNLDSSPVVQYIFLDANGEYPFIESIDSTVLPRAVKMYGFVIEPYTA